MSYFESLIVKYFPAYKVGSKVTMVNLCSGSQKLPGYYSVDFGAKADFRIDLRFRDLPFRDGSLTSVVCMSAINYFSRTRAVELVTDIYRALKQGGVTRFGVQDLEDISKKYVMRDKKFFFQKLPDGRDRFEGSTIADKYVAWFYGYAIKGVPCQYFYDYESLSLIFREAGFNSVEKKRYRESRLSNIDLIDNREDQMFFLEAVK